MRKLVLPILAIAIAIAAPAAWAGKSKKSVAPATASSDVFDLPYLMKDLNNGLRVIVVKTDYPDIVNLQIPVQTGSRNEVEKGKSGFAHFFEHMMFRGTETYPQDVYSSILKNAGADQNAYTSDDLTNYHITFTKPDLEKILELEADRFQNLSYTEEQFRTEALAVKGEYLKNFSNPVQQLFERLRDKSFTTTSTGSFANTCKLTTCTSCLSAAMLRIYMHGSLRINHRQSNTIRQNPNLPMKTALSQRCRSISVAPAYRR